jgi:transposase
MRKDNTKFIGLDVHKETISIAIAEEGRKGEVRSYGTIRNDFESLDKFVTKQVSLRGNLKFVYEAGPTGYGIHRHLAGNGFDCIVVAPSMIPKRSGVRIKNDRRDAVTLARLHRAGEIDAIYIPDPEDEAMRDLLRGRDDARISLRKAKQRLHSFLLRHGAIYSGKSSWTKAHFNWLSDLKMAHPAQHVALQEYIDAIHESSQRVTRLTDIVTEMVKTWRLAPIVIAIQALRGVSLLTAAIVVAEVGVLTRFSKPTQLMAYLGLVPSEHSSGDSVKRGGITKAGNGYARRALVEASWTYRFPARVTRHLLKRSRDLPKNVQQIAWKAQLRLCTRFQRLVNRGKPKQVVTTAIARELIAFIWAISREVELSSR